MQTPKSKHVRKGEALFLWENFWFVLNFINKTEILKEVIEIKYKTCYNASIKNLEVTL